MIDKHKITPEYFGKVPTTATHCTFWS